MKRKHWHQKKIDSDFDEEYYLARYPDIAEAVARGQLPDGASHYIRWGRAEGRHPSLAAEHKSTTPVVFFIFNRPELTRMVWEQIRAYRPGLLFVIADAPRNEREQVLTDAVRAVVEKVDWPCHVVRDYATHNMGCKNRIASGLQRVFASVNEAIILEDDCLPHPDFFDFCSRMLKAFRDDDRVMHISGSSYLPPGTSGGRAWFSRHSDIWGWATWRRAFQHYDLELKAWSRPRMRGMASWLGDSWVERQFWAEHFDRVQQGEIDTWDYQWHHTVYRRGGLAVIPPANLITNLGHGSGATHTQDEDSPIARLQSFGIGPVPAPSPVRRNPQWDTLFFVRRYLADTMPLLPKTAFPACAAGSAPVDLVICHNEISDRHGVGALLGKLTRGRERVTSIRTTTHFEIAGDLKNSLEWQAEEHPRSGAYQRMAQWIGVLPMGRILAVPYTEDEAWRAIAAAQISGAPLTVYLMDDQNIHASGISDEAMRSLLRTAERRCAICEEMAAAYAEKFACAVEVLYPPVAPEERFDAGREASTESLREGRAVLIGNLWTAEWIRRFAAIIHEAGLEVDWYGNAGGGFRAVSDAECARAGLHVKGFLASEKLLQTIRRYRLAIIPTACAQSDVSHAWMARLSFPSKIMTLAFGGGLPLVVLADESNPAGNFVERWQLGQCIPYDSAALRAAVASCSDAAWRGDFQQRLGPVMEQFSLERAVAWVWKEEEIGGMARN